MATVPQLYFQTYRQLGGILSETHFHHKRIEFFRPIFAKYGNRWTIRQFLKEPLDAEMEKTIRAIIKITPC